MKFGSTFTLIDIPPLPHIKIYAHSPPASKTHPGTMNLLPVTSP
jgi:hypothetical protein